MIVLIILRRRRIQFENREDLEDRKRKSGFYARYATQRFGTEGAPPSNGRANAPNSRRDSDDSLFDFKEDYGPYHLAPIPSPEAPKPVATRTVV